VQFTIQLQALKYIEASPSLVNPYVSGKLQAGSRDQFLCASYSYLHHCSAHGRLL